MSFISKVYPSSIEHMQQLHEVVDVHDARPLLPELNAVEHLVHLLPNAEVLRHLLALHAALHLVVLLHHEQDAGGSESRAQGLILPDEANPGESVPLGEVDGGRRVAGLYSHHAALNLWRWSEVVLANLHEMIHPCEELGVDGKPAVEFVSRLGHQSLSELALEHENCAPEKGSV